MGQVLVEKGVHGRHSVEIQPIYGQEENNNKPVILSRLSVQPCSLVKRWLKVSTSQARP